jgi:hypothetical protein
LAVGCSELVLFITTTATIAAITATTSTPIPSASALRRQ